jgi:hypothetical protein
VEVESSEPLEVGEGYNLVVAVVEGVPPGERVAKSRMEADSFPREEIVLLLKSLVFTSGESVTTVPKTLVVVDGEVEEVLEAESVAVLVTELAVAAGETVTTSEVTLDTTPACATGTACARASNNASTSTTITVSRILCPALRLRRPFPSNPCTIVVVHHPSSIPLNRPRTAARSNFERSAKVEQGNRLGLIG